MNKQLPNVRYWCFILLEKNSEKSYGGGGIPTPFYVPGVNDPRKKPALIIVGKTDCQKEN